MKGQERRRAGEPGFCFSGAYGQHAAGWSDRSCRRLVTGGNCREGISVQPQGELPTHQNWPTKEGAALGGSCPVCREATAHTQNHVSPQRPQVLGAWDLLPLGLPRTSIRNPLPAMPVAPDTSLGFLGFLCLIREAPCPKSSPCSGLSLAL